MPLALEEPWALMTGCLAPRNGAPPYSSLSIWLSLIHIYVVEQESGPDHDKHFVVAVRFNSDKVARGEGRSKKVAEQHAAREALKLLGVIKEK